MMEEISNQDLKREEELLSGQLKGLAEADARASDKRVARIIDKAMYEAVVKDTSTFVFTSMGVALSGIMNGLNHSLEHLSPVAAGRHNTDKSDGNTTKI